MSWDAVSIMQTLVADLLTSDPNKSPKKIQAVCCFFCQSFPATSKILSLIEMLFFSSRCFTHHKTINGIWPALIQFMGSGLLLSPCPCFHHVVFVHSLQIAATSQAVGQLVNDLWLKMLKHELPTRQAMHWLSHGLSSQTWLSNLIS